METDINTLRHSCSHMLAAAVKKLFPNAKLAIGPAIDDGYYYDFDIETPFTPEDLKKISDEMNKIIRSKVDFVQKEISKDEAKEMFKGEPYKLELIGGLEGDSVSTYMSGDFVDLCSGPHVENSKVLKAFKLMKVAGAYWKGDSKNKMLQRIYGVVFPEKDGLKAYLLKLEESEKRNHVKLGKQLDLFSVNEAAPGMPFFHDKGAFIFDELVDFMKGKMRALNYEINKTPIILNKSLWLTSGHWDHYKENMYFTKVDNADYAVKPMNCPGNLLVYKANVHSYRDLPIKAGEFGLVHRHEMSGVLNGLFRVRSFTQDDAHIFCSEDQLKDSIIELIDLIDSVYSTFGFTYKVELSTKPEKAIGSQEVWDKAENSLKDALEAKKMDFVINEGDGAFYGPKIDFHLTDAIGRTWQCGTIQVDFSMPEKFGLTYEGKDGKSHTPVMVHRAIYGSVERFLGILIEHYAGKFPLWLNPSQVKILTVADKFNDYAQEVEKSMKSEGLRVSVDFRAESISKKVRDAQALKIPLIIIIGEKEVEAKTVSVRTLDNKVKFGVKLEDFFSKVQENIDKKEETVSFD
jgi:threonyl-tRNA synthetase